MEKTINIPDAAGMADVVLALQWVKENIEVFGGIIRTMSTVACGSPGAAERETFTLNADASGRRALP